MTISLGRRLPDASSSRPGSWMRNEPLRAAPERANFFLLGLAPNGVYRARPVARPAGELLPHRFTLTNRENPVGGLLSVALSLALRPVGVTHHCVLRSPDFPPAKISALPFGTHRSWPAIIWSAPVHIFYFQSPRTFFEPRGLQQKHTPLNLKRNAGSQNNESSGVADYSASINQPESKRVKTMFGELQPVGGGDPIPLLKTLLVVGRRESADIVLRFPNVSGSHCELSVVEGYWIVKDLGSSNGTKVNGIRVSEQRVDPGDKLSVGKHEFELFYEPTKLGATSAPAEKIVSKDPFSRSLLETAGLEARHLTEAKTAPSRKHR